VNKISIGEIKWIKKKNPVNNPNNRSELRKERKYLALKSPPAPIPESQITKTLKTEVIIIHGGCDRRLGF